MGYAHVSRGVRLDSKGGLRFEQGSKDVLGEGREVAEVITVRHCAGTRKHNELLPALVWFVVQASHQTSQHSVTTSHTVLTVTKLAHGESVRPCQWSEQPACLNHAPMSDTS
jgi:hypothetical protein